MFGAGHPGQRYGDGANGTDQDHPGREVGEHGTRGDCGSRDARDGGRGRVAQGLDGGEQAERGATQPAGRQSREDGVLGRRDRADADPRQDERDRQHRDDHVRHGEYAVRGSERRDTTGQDQGRAAGPEPISQAPGPLVGLC